jgi:hypothetical protein
LIKNGFFAGYVSNTTGIEMCFVATKVAADASTIGSATAVRAGLAMTIILAQRSNPTNNNVQNKPNRLRSAINRCHVNLIFLFISNLQHCHT